MKVPLDQAIAATGATLHAGEVAPAALRVSTDTRTIELGDTFVALRGERFDGHDFAAQAAASGAALLVLDRFDARVSGVATMLVRDTKAAYVALAGAARTLFGGRVIAITGSVGKTTTKAFLAQLLATTYGDRVLAAPDNENNEVGVSKLLLSASNDAHDVVVVEMGARHYGDVAILVEIARPQIGILTSVGDAHVEIMGSRARLEETKWALFSHGARAVLGAGDSVSRRRAAELAPPPHWFAAFAQGAAMPDDPQLRRLVAFIGDRRLLSRTPEGIAQYDVNVRVPGLHNRANAAAAIAGAVECAVPLQAILEQIPELVLPGGRYDRIAIEGGPRMIYDAYNASAGGMIAALDAFAGEPAARRIAVLASMAELGEESEALHERVGAHAAVTVDVLLVSGDFAEALARGARRAGLDAAKIVAVAGNGDAARWLREHTRGDDLVLLKGSRKYKMEEIIQELQAECRA